MSSSHATNSHSLGRLRQLGVSLASAAMSIRLGLVLLACIVAYLTLASVSPWLRNALDTDESGVYAWWPHVALWMALCLNIAAATALRIPLRLDRLGAWMAHLGVLLLAIGSMWYVSHRVRGQLMLVPLGHGAFMPAETYVDQSVRALNVTVLSPDRPSPTLQTPLGGLPLRRLSDALSIDARIGDPNIAVRVTGYRPSSRVVNVAHEGGPVERHAVEVHVALGGDQHGDFRLEPGRLAAGPGFVLRFAPNMSAEQIEELTSAPGKPTHVLTFRAAGKTVDSSVRPGQKLPLPDLGYNVHVSDFGRDRSAGPGPDGEGMPVLQLTIRRVPTSQPADERPSIPIIRTVYAGDDSLNHDEAMDFDADGAPGGLLDPNLQVSYTFNPSEAVDEDVYIVTFGADHEPILILVGPTGMRGRFRMPLGQEVVVREPVDVSTMPNEAPPRLSFRLDQLYQRMYVAGELANAAHAPRAAASQAIRVQVSRGEFNLSQWISFSAFPNDSLPQQVFLPNGRRVFIQFTRLRHPLGATLRVRHLEVPKYPGTNMPRDYITRLEVAEADGVAWHGEIRNNKPLKVGPFELIQGRMDPMRPQAEPVILNVATRPGLPVIWLGAILIGLGPVFAFYVKPVLVGRRRKRAAGENDEPAPGPEDRP